MSNFVVFLIVLMIAISAVYIASGMHVWRRVRGPKVVICPETGGRETVWVDIRHSVATDVFENAAAVRLADCSRWPKRRSCNQPCVAQVVREVTK